MDLKCFKIKIDVYVLLLIALVLTKLMHIDTPIYWDETRSYYTTMEMLHTPEGFTSISPLFADDVGHPILFPFLGYIFTKIFPHDLLFIRLFILIISFIGIYFTYLTAIMVSKDKQASFVAAALLFLSPIYFAQSVMFLADLPLAAFGMICLYYTFKHKPAKFTVIASLTSVIRESSLGLLIPMSVLWFNYFAKKKKVFHFLILLFFSILPLILFFINHKIVKGRFSDTGALADWGLRNLNLAFYNIIIFFKWIFILQGRWILSVFLVLLLFKKDINQNVKHLLLYFCLSLSLFFAVFSLHSAWLVRYLIPLMPAFYILSITSLFLLVKNIKLRWLLLTIVLCCQLYNLYGDDKCEEISSNDCHGSFEHNMQHLDVIKVRAEFHKFLEDNKDIFSNKKVHSIVDLPFNIGLNVPIYYHDNPIPEKELEKEYDYAFWGTNQNPREVQFLLEEIKRRKMKVMKEFNVNNKIILIYQRAKSE